MNQVMRFPSSVKRDPAIEVWMKAHAGELGVIDTYDFNEIGVVGEEFLEIAFEATAAGDIANPATRNKL